MPNDTPDYIPIGQWAEEDQPRQKMVIKGRDVLSDSELIAILIGSGTKNISAVDLAKKILAAADNDLNQLAKMNVNQLKKFPGMGEAKAVAIIAALELGRRRKAEDAPLKKLVTSRDVFEYIKADMMDLGHEEFWVIYLNRANTVKRKLKISEGGISGTVADSRIIFKHALEEMASSIVLVHNHPSGNMTPSPEDILLTRKIIEAGRLLNISIIDHIIVSNNSYYSFADSGKI